MTTLLHGPDSLVRLQKVDMNLSNLLFREGSRLSRAIALAIAAIGLAIIGSANYWTGYDISLSLFYIGPIALATWYAGRQAGCAFAVLACMTWYAADAASGHQYSYALIPMWNAVVRLGCFLIIAILLDAVGSGARALNRQARTDPLTGVLNRREFDANLDRDLIRAQRKNSPLTLVYIDLDNFKELNDRYGHPIGDDVLRAISRALGRQIRSYDTAARLGGDEFGLILPDADEPIAKAIVSRVIDDLYVLPQVKTYGVTCSIGVVSAASSSISSEELIETADRLMYEVKRAGRGQVKFGQCRSPSRSSTGALPMKARGRA